MISKEEKIKNFKEWKERRSKYNRFELMWNFDSLYDSDILLYQKIYIILQKIFPNKIEREKRKQLREYLRNGVYEKCNNEKEKAICSQVLPVNKSDNLHQKFTINN